jgi:acetylornithine aminotransferase/acetylornithine/N-succinyldiaminopimelate aminotransferase
MLEALQAQARRLINCSPAFHNEQMARLASLVADSSGLDSVFLCNSGAEANEGAIKLARKWGQVHRGGAFEIVTMHGSFHGRTLATMSASGKPAFEPLFEPKVPGFRKVPLNDLDAVAAAITEGTVAVMVEPIQGEAGVNVPDDDYLPGLRKLCDESGALLILDEIQTGIARTGRLWCYQHAGIEPDIMTVAKALANGLPIGATLARREVASALTPGTHGSTFGGNPFVTAVALACFTTILDEKIAERAARTGRHLLTRLQALAAGRPLIREVRGRGLLIAVELTQPAGPVVDACREAGLLVLTAGEKVLRLAPPLIVDERDCDRALAVIEDALARVGT